MNDLLRATWGKIDWASGFICPLTSGKPQEGICNTAKSMDQPIPYLHGTWKILPSRYTEGEDSG